MFSDTYNLVTELNNNTLTMQSSTVDAYKVTHALQCIISKLHQVECSSISNYTEVITLKNKIYDLEKSLSDHKFVLQKILKDYPEIIVEKPFIFVNEVC